MMAKEAQATSINDQVAFDTDPQDDSSLSANTSAARNETQEVRTLICYLPFEPQHSHGYSPHCSPHISYVTIWENLIKHQHISCLGIISFILLTCIYDQLVIL